MIFNIVLKENKDDKFTVAQNDNNKSIVINSIVSSNSDDDNYVSHSIQKNLKRKELLPSNEAIDFIDLSLCAYVSDQLIPRDDHGYYKWNRFYKLYVPVTNLSKWKSLKNEIETFLSFLSGDKWEIHFRQRIKYNEKIQRKENEIEATCLLSGGMDSFIGASDLLGSGVKNIALVSHHKMGNSGEKSTQENLVLHLQNEYSTSSIIPNYFYVQAQKNSNFTGESSQRARSIIFIALGLAVANSYSNDIPIYIPENGLISLNVPLTKSRYGSHSTKTTHPYFINAVNTLFEKLAIGNRLINPYRFYTKGEMLINSQNVNFIKKHIYKTISCSKAGHYIQWYGRKELHCGHCTPCIIRRAAMKKGNIDKFQGNYVRDVLSDTFRPSEASSRDLIAFKIAIERMNQSNGPRIFELLKSGTIPGNADDINKYVEVYERGMSEVKDFLYKKK